MLRTSFKYRLLAIKYKEVVVRDGGNFSTVRAFVQEMDGGLRHRSRAMKPTTVPYWAKVKVKNGDAPGDDMRRYFKYS